MILNLLKINIKIFDFAKLEIKFSPPKAVKLKN